MVVQIDESLFVHKCKVSRKVIVLGGVITIVIIKVHYIMVCYCLVIQHHWGLPPRYEVWVLGIVDTSTTPAHGYVKVVQ